MPGSEVSSEAVPEYATEAQVASVIAEFEPGWRDVVAEKIDCQLTWEIASQDPTNLEANMKGLNCMSSIHTMVTTTGTAIIELDKLEIPPSMQDLVSETKGDLSKISSSGVEMKCDLSGDSAESECELPMLQFVVGSMRLENTLNAWGPYL